MVAFSILPVTGFCQSDIVEEVPTLSAPIRLPDDPVELFLPTPAVATASPTSIQIPSPRATSGQSSSLDPFSLQIEFAEGTLKVSNTLQNRGRVIALYERALAASCPRQKARCEEIITRLLDLNPGNFPAVCQRYGLKSPECTEVAATQETGWYDVDAGRWRTLSGIDGGSLDSSDMSVAIELKRRKPQIDKLVNERETLLRMARRETAQEQALEKVFLDGIALSCTQPKLIFLEPSGFQGGLENALHDSAPLTSLVHNDTPPTKAPAAMPSPSHTRTTSSPLDSVLQGLNALPTTAPRVTATSAPTSRLEDPPEERLRRVRLLSRECYEFVRAALIVRPELIQARCALSGWYAPACRQSSIAPATKDSIDSF